MMSAAEPRRIGQPVRRIPLDGSRSRSYAGRLFLAVCRRIVIVFGFCLTDNDARNVLFVIGRQMRLLAGGCLAGGHYSVIPAMSGVSHARCCPPSSAIIWPVMERFSQK